MPTEVYYRLPSWNSLQNTMKKWHLLAPVCICAPRHWTPQIISFQPADARMPSVPVLSNTQLYLTGGHSKMVCQTLSLVVHILIYYIDNAYGMEPSVPEYTRDWVRARGRNIEPTSLTSLTRGGDSIVCLWDVQWPAIQGQTPYNFLASIEHCPNLDKEESAFIDIFGLDWSPDGNFLASCCGDSIVRIWSRTAGKLIYSEKVHRATVVQVRWSPDGQYLASGSVDTTICLIDFKTRVIVRRYNDIGGAYRLAGLYSLVKLQRVGSVSAVTWLNDHSFIATTSDGVIRIYQTSTAAVFRIFRGHALGELPQIQLNSNRKALISASEDMTARIWNVTPLKAIFNSDKQEMEPAEGSVGGQSGQDCIMILKGHSSDLWEAAWCPSADGSPEKFVATYVLRHFRNTSPDNFLDVQPTTRRVFGRWHRANASRLLTITGLHPSKHRHQFQP